MSGLVLLDKPEGVTSFSATAAVRRLFGEKKAGHTGTLDPMATGVLPVLLGSATRLAGWLAAGDKCYTATFCLGQTTDTLDRTGRVLSVRPVDASLADVEAVLPRFRGEIEQTPPAFSAVKRDGRPLYAYARQGETVAVPPRKVTVYELRVTAFAPPGAYTVLVRCSKGTYIRALCADIGEALGCGAVLTALRRETCCGFSVNECVTADRLRENPAAYRLPAERAVAALGSVCVTERQAERFCHGGSLSADRLTAGLPEGEPLRVRRGDTLYGIGEMRSGELRPICVL